MSNKTDISIVLPVHKLDEVTKGLFSNSVESVKQQKVLPSELLIVVPKNTEALEYIKNFNFGEIKEIVKIVENEGETDFCSQVNLGIQNVKSDWVSLLEFDDEYANSWFKNVQEYQKAYPEVGIFLPIVIDVDTNNNYLGLTNEAVWAQSFSDELGILDLNALLAYQNFNIDGMVFKKSIIDDNGGFKSNIKLTFIYEFLLRMAFKDVKIMTIPKFGYKHVNQRPDSLFANYALEMDPTETKWWLAQAKKEYYFDKDRKITYAKQTT